MKTLFTRLLLSRRVAVGAMAVLGLVLGLSSFASGVDPDRLEALRQERPLRVWVFERLRPEALTRSPAFLALPGYIALAVAASIAQRGRGWWRARRGPGSLERFVARREVRLAAGADAARRRLDAAARALGLPRGAGGLEGRRGDLGFAGSLVFHAGLLVTMVGVAASAAARFGGELVLTEGAPVVVGPEAMLRADPPEGLAGLSGTRLAVSQVSAGFGGTGTLTDVSAVVEHGAGGERQMVSVNVPLEVRGYQLTLHRYGFAPGLEARRPDGREAAVGVAVLRLLPPGVEDSLALEGGGELKLRLYPDWAPKDGAPASRSLEPLRPVLRFTWLEGGREVASGAVPRGGEVEVAGYRVAFPTLGYWVDLLVGRDPGLPWVSLGALLIVLGLAARFTWHEQAWRATVRPEGAACVVAFALSARYFPAALEQRADALRAALETSR